MTQKEIRIENKPTYCHAWTLGKKLGDNDTVMCNTIPCCGYANHGRTDIVLPGFTTMDKIGKHQAPYYNDGRKKESEKL